MAGVQLVLWGRPVLRVMRGRQPVSGQPRRFSLHRRRDFMHQNTPLPPHTPHPTGSAALLKYMLLEPEQVSTAVVCPDLSLLSLGFFSFAFPT